MFREILYETFCTVLCTYVTAEDLNFPLRVWLPEKLSVPPVVGEDYQDVVKSDLYHWNLNFFVQELFLSMGVDLKSGGRRKGHNVRKAPVTKNVYVKLLEKLYGWVPLKESLVKWHLIQDNRRNKIIN